MKITDEEYKKVLAVALKEWMIRKSTNKDFKVLLNSLL